MTSPNTITILRPFSGRGMARKAIQQDGTIDPAANLKDFRHETRTFSTIRELHEIVSSLVHQNAFVVRGAPASDRQPIHRRQALIDGRGDNGFLDVPKQWLALDIDGVKLPATDDWREDVDGAVEYVIGRLPEAFWDVSCSWAFTASHGLAIDKNATGKKRWTGGYVGDVVRLRLWFYLSRPIGSAEAQAWIGTMGDFATVDKAVGRTVQPIYTARPATWNNIDPLAKFDVPLSGFRQGLEEVVAVPPDLVAQTRWARAEGRLGSAASHPSADAAISGIGLPSHPGGRSEIRAHMISAAMHLARNESKAGREPKAEELHAAICKGIERHRAAIDKNLTAAGRGWGDVSVYTDTNDLLRLCAWMAECVKNDTTKSQDGGGARKIVRRVDHAPKPDENVIFVSRDEARAIAKEKVSAFVKAVKAHAVAPKDELGNAPPAPQHLLTTPTGAGKTHAVIEDGVVPLAEMGVVVLQEQNTRMADEAAGRIWTTAPHLNVVVRRGMERDDPDQPGQLMCHRIDDVRAVLEHGLPVYSTLCKAETKSKSETQDEATGRRRIETEKTCTYCPSFGQCGYIKQKDALAKADVVVMAHTHLWVGIPEDVPKPIALFVDEDPMSGATGGTGAPQGIGLGLLLSPPSLISGPLEHYRKSIGRVLSDEPDGQVRAEVLAPWAADAGRARELEWELAKKLSFPVTRLTGEALRTKLKTAMGGAYGHNAVRRVAGFWRAVEAAAELPDGARSGRLWLWTDPETGQREARYAWKEDLAAGWDKVPVMVMDATANHDILRHVFGRIEPSPRYSFRNPHVFVHQVVDRSFAHATLVPQNEERDPDGSKAKTARNNAAKVFAALVADALDRYDGQDVLAIVPQKVEDQWREVGLPPWLHLMHHGATVGVDRYKDVRAIYIIGRLLPSAQAVEREAGALSGVAVELTGYQPVEAIIATADGKGVATTALQHRDPLAEALRRQTTEAELVQAAGRIRAINRGADSPADINIWTDIAVPDLGPVEPLLWQGPTIDEVMLARGVWLAKARDAAEVYEDWSHQYIDRERAGAEPVNFCLKELYRQKLTTSPLPVRYRLAKPGSGPARAVFLNSAPEAARQFLEKKLGPLAVFEVLTDRPEPPTDGTRRHQVDPPPLQHRPPTAATEVVRCGSSVLLCTAPDDVPLRLTSGRTLAIAPWELEDCLSHEGDGGGAPRTIPPVLFRRSTGMMMDIFLPMRQPPPGLCNDGVTR